MRLALGRWRRLGLMGVQKVGNLWGLRRRERFLGIRQAREKFSLDKTRRCYVCNLTLKIVEHFPTQLC